MPSSGDVRDLAEAAAGRDSRARLTLDVYIHAVRRYLGAFLVELGGVDVVTCSGGIGENSAQLRSGVCAGLGELGIQVDGGLNLAVRREGRISPEGARVAVWVLPADEERIVASATAEVAACP